MTAFVVSPAWSKLDSVTSLGMPGVLDYDVAFCPEVRWKLGSRLCCFCGVS